MKTSARLQKITAAISLVILALGFSMIGLLAVFHQQTSGNAVEFSSAICVLGGCAGLAAGSVFFVAALLYLRRPSRVVA